MGVERGGGAVPATIYKICDTRFGRRPSASGCFPARRSTSATASSISRPPAQAAETAAKHFAGADDLMLIAVDADALGRGAEMGALARRRPVSASLWRAAAHRGAVGEPLPLGPDGRHVFPELMP